MKKTFVTNIALLLLVNLLVKPFWMFGIDRTVQVELGAETYGYYFSLFNLSLIFNIFLDAGLTNFNTKNIAQHSQLLSKYLSNLVVLKFLLAILYFVVLLVFAYALQYEREQLWLLIVLGINQFLLSFILYLRSNISGLHLFRTDSFVSVLDRLLMITICSVLLWGNIDAQPFRIEWFVYAQTAAYVTTAIVAFLFLLPRLHLFRLRFNPQFLRVVVRQTYPYALLVFLMSIYGRIDGVMLERLLPDSTPSGIYAHAFRILDAVSQFSYLFAGILLPIFAKMLRSKSSVHQLVRLSFFMLIVPAATVTIASFFYSTEIMQLLYNEHIEESSVVFGTLIIGFVPIASNYIFGTLLTANGNLRILNKVAVFCMLLNVVLNFVLIPHFEAFGAAIASVVTLTLSALLQAFYALRYFAISVRRSTLVRLSLFLGGNLLFVYLSRTLNLPWFYQYTGLIAASLLAAIALKLIDIKHFVDILRSDDN